MPYEVSNSQLLRLTELAIQDPEIVKGMDDANLETEDLRSEAKRLAADIWSSTSREISAFDESETTFLEKQQEFREEFTAGEFPLPFKRLRTVLVATYSIIWLGLLALFVLSGLMDGWRVTLGKLVTKQVGIPVISGLVCAVVLGILARYLTSAADKRRRGWQDNLDKRKRDEWKNRGLEQREEEQKAKKSALDKLVLEKVNAKLREYLNGQTAASFDTHLRILRAPGLAEVFDKSYAIDTSSQDSLQFLLKNMPGGSIGIAGPRGAGKTTLLRLFCGRKKILDTLKGLPVLSVLVSAPVEYQPRDFILYLFASVCRSFLDYKTVQHDQPRPFPEPFSESQPGGPTFLRSLRPLSLVCYFVGLTLVILSIFAALVIALPTRPATSQPPISAEPGAVAEQTESTPTTAPAAQPTTRDQPTQPQPFVAFLKALEIKPGSLLTWGLFSIAASLLLGVVTGVTRRDFVPLPIAFKRLLFRRSDRLAWERRMNEQQLEEEAKRRRTIPEEQKDLTELALDWLRNIKFQQSFTSGWSGALKLPIGLEGGITRAINLSQNQLSLPEIVDALTRFLARVSDQCQVIIGIDELDKLESDDKARQFLNEIKSIFGLDRCFYLISVSENAMSSFERRGLPFRDVFDSSFDTIVYVDYLDFAGSRSLIEQRIVGKPIPFFALSYCLSGGLARDMIRIFRSLIELRQTHPEQDDLETLSQALIKSDLKAKLRAAAITAKKLKLKTEVDEFVAELYRFDSTGVSELALLKAIQSLFPRQTVNDLQAGKKGEDIGRLSDYENLNALQEELASYLYYLLTILQFFQNSLSQESLTTEEEGGTLDYLARARQMFAINPSITRSMLNRFRGVHSLQSPSDKQATG